MSGWPAQEARQAIHGMVASVNPLASAAGLRVLQAGGNAVDAAVAAGAVLTVVEPWSGQLGGDAFLLVAARGEPGVTAINRRGSPPPAGYILRQPDLARTLRVLQTDGPEAFYRGRIAAAIVSAAERSGGLFSAEDFARHRTEVLEPVETTYRGWRVIEQPPVSQGLIVLIGLNILETGDLPDEPAERVHLQVEANKLAMGERLRAVGDGAAQPAGLAALISKQRGRELAARLDPLQAASLLPAPAGHPDTTYLCVVDEARNVVSYIHSLYAGNGIVAGHTGILLNNRMGCFNLEEGSPNRLAPGKRPMHTLNSWMLLREGRPMVVGGTPGSFWQVQTNLQLITNLVDRELPLQAAVDAPRWTMGSQTSWTETGLSLEGRFGSEAAGALTRLGHRV